MKYNYIQLKDLASLNSSEFHSTDLNQAYKFCEDLAKSHYENFPVGSVLIPKPMRKHFYAIYAFSRMADDIADENLTTTPEERYALLDKLEESLNSDIELINTPILKAVRNTVLDTKVELCDLQRLLVAFKMDINFKQPESFADLYNYCHYSANPIGEMLLKLFDETDAKNIELSDKICTALQLVNFWQDISRDMPNGRYYIPKNLLIIFGLRYDNLKSNDTRLQVLLDQLYQETEQLFESGKELCYLVKNKRLKLELSLIISSGIRILEKCKNLKTEIVVQRPDLGKSDLLNIFIKAINL